MNWQTATEEEKAAANAAYDARRAQEIAAAKVAAEQFAEKVKAVSKALTNEGVANVVVKDPADGVTRLDLDLCLIEYPEQRIYLSKDSYRHKGRIVISGSWPRGKNNSLFYPRDGKGGAITVAETKTPEQIAKDIVRRFLPEYREAYAEQAQLKANEETYEDNKAKFTAAIVQALGAKSHPYSPNCVTGYEPTWHEFQINGGDSADIQIRSLTRAQALEVVALIKSWGPKNKLRIEV